MNSHFFSYLFALHRILFFREKCNETNVTREELELEDIEDDLNPTPVLYSDSSFSSKQTASISRIHQIRRYNRLTQEDIERRTADLATLINLLSNFSSHSLEVAQSIFQWQKGRITAILFKWILYLPAKPCISEALIFLKTVLSYKSSDIASSLIEGKIHLVIAARLLSLVEDLHSLFRALSVLQCLLNEGLSRTERLKALESFANTASPEEFQRMITGELNQTGIDEDSEDIFLDSPESLPDGSNAEEWLPSSSSSSSSSSYSSSSSSSSSSSTHSPPETLTGLEALQVLLRQRESNSVALDLLTYSANYTIKDISRFTVSIERYRNYLHSYTDNQSQRKRTLFINKLLQKESTLKLLHNIHTLATAICRDFFSNRHLHSLPNTNTFPDGESEEQDSDTSDSFNTAVPSSLQSW